MVRVENILCFIKKVFSDFFEKSGKFPGFPGIPGNRVLEFPFPGNGKIREKQKHYVQLVHSFTEFPLVTVDPTTDRVNTLPLSY